MMQVNYLRHEQIDKQRWDATIREAFNGVIYAYSWYLDIVAPGWNALITENYQHVMPLPAKQKCGVRYIYQPLFTQQLGVFSIGKLSPDIVDSFLKSASRHFRYYEINLNIFNKVPAHTSWQMRARSTYELDLIDPYDHLYKRFSQNTKRNVQKAQKAGLQLVHLADSGKVIELFKQHKGTELKGVNEQDYTRLHTLMQQCMQQGRGQVWAVHNTQKKLIAGAFFVEANGKVIYLFSASSPEAKATGAMHFLINAFMHDNSARNLTLDFEGSDIPSLARFYKGFGGKEAVYLHIRHNGLPWYLRWMKA